MKSARVSLLLLSFLLSSCATREAVQMASAGSLLVLAPAVPVVSGVRTITGTNYKRRLLVPDVYRLRERVYVLSNDGGWFTEGRARYGGGGGPHICLSAWVIDLDAETKDKEGRISLSERNLDEFFWEKHDPRVLEKVRRDTPAAKSNEYFAMKELTPFVTLVVSGQVYELKLKQD